MKEKFFIDLMAKLGLTVMGVASIFMVAIPMSIADYAEVPVSDGGTLNGKITFKGSPPPAKEFLLSKFPQSKFCGTNADSDPKKDTRYLHEVTVKGGALNDVVVYVEHVEKGKPFKFDGADVKVELCKFLVQNSPSTFVGVVKKKVPLRVLNTDADPSDPKSVNGVLHNPHGYEMFGAKSITLFNLPLPDKGGTINKPVLLKKSDSFVKLECDQHNYMNVYFQPVDNPYYAIVGADGTFSIDGIPPGKYEVHAWHPILGTMEKEVTVTANGKSSLNFEFEK
ncbi:MAG: carboxypeptidase regulatory-like domain-containing protein [Nitrospirae bacterium]|nr:carboxypeptidase regulatory-like domain-containing protein [Nitrospirota bacterium]